MQRLHRFLPTAGLALTLGLLSLTACKKDCPEPDDAPTFCGTVGTGLVGNWLLVDRQCYCLPGPLPNESITFTANGYKMYQDGQLTESGTYADTTASFCGGGSSSVPALRFRNDAGELPYYGAITLSGNSLVLDYGSPCDAARNTYRRVK